LHPESIVSTMPQIMWQCSQTFSLHTYHYKNRRIILTQLKASQLQLSIKLYSHRSLVASLVPRFPLWTWPSL